MKPHTHATGEKGLNLIEKITLSPFEKWRRKEGRKGSYTHYVDKSISVDKLIKFLEEAKEFDAGEITLDMSGATPDQKRDLPKEVPCSLRDSSDRVEYPNLERVEGEYNINIAENPYQPKLAYVGGCIFAPGVIELDVPSLGHVGTHTYVGVSGPGTSITLGPKTIALKANKLTELPGTIEGHGSLFTVADLKSLARAHKLNLEEAWYADLSSLATTDALLFRYELSGEPENTKKRLQSIVLPKATNIGYLAVGTASHLDFDFERNPRACVEIGVLSMRSLSYYKNPSSESNPAVELRKQIEELERQGKLIVGVIIEEGETDPSAEEVEQTLAEKRKTLKKAA